MAKIKEVQPHLIAGETREWGDHRTADTSGLSPHFEWLQRNTRELINWLKPELSSLGPAYEILLALADRPCSLRLSEGQDWSQIETDLYAQHVAAREEDIPINIDEIREVVDLATIVDCGHVETWIEEVAAYLGQNPPHVADTVHRMITSGELRWSDPIGALITA